MLGRVLFAVVWLIIAAGFVLPQYAGDVPTTAVAAASDPVQLVAGSDLAGCEDCPVPDARVDCQHDCPCGQALATAAGAAEDPLRLSAFVIVHPQPSGLPPGPQPLPPKLPAI